MLENIGKSVEDRDIIALKLGRGEKEIFINGAHHAREYITSILILNQIEYIAKAYESGTKIGEYDVKSLLDEVSIWFVPLVNPDGVELCREGIVSVKDKQALSGFYDIKRIFTDWKSNISGVDLNRNYNARWETIPRTVNKPSSRFYPGPNAFSEPETIALRDFCLRHSFDASIA